MDSFCGLELINTRLRCDFKIFYHKFSGGTCSCRITFFQKHFLSKFLQISFRKSSKFQVNWVSGWKVIKKCFVGGGGAKGVGLGGGPVGPPNLIRVKHFCYLTIFSQNLTIFVQGNFWNSGILSVFLMWNLWLPPNILVFIRACLHVFAWQPQNRQRSYNGFLMVFCSHQRRFWLPGYIATCFGNFQSVTEIKPLLH